MKLLIVLIVILLCQGCSSTPTVKEEPELLHYDTGGFTEDLQTLVIESDSSEPVSIEFYTSNTVDDTLCTKTYTYSSFTIEPNQQKVRHLNFSRKGSPSRALYEWHVCFEIDGKRFRGWRGFDPGPGASLEISCDLDSQQISVGNTDVYLCHAVKVTHNDKNYADFGQHCWRDDVCRRFEGESDYSLFLQRGPSNVALILKVPVKTLETLDVGYEYIDDKAALEYREWLSEMTKSACGYSEEEFCRNELAELEAAFENSDGWRYRLTEKAIANAYSEISAEQDVVFSDTSHVDYRTTYKFSPHRSEHPVVFFYSVVCPADQRTPRRATCTLYENQGFFVEEPSEYFSIEDTSDVKTALWAYEQHKQIKVIPNGEWMERWLSHPHRVSTIEIDDTIAKFYYHSGGCSHEVWYQVVGENERLEFLKVAGGLCV